ncbi:MAG: Fic family protein, partial [Acidobacteria bacterium]|nr:Fic family protein [Acidobacteriota bacterium]
AEDILSTMKAAGYDVRETDPFTPQQTFGTMNVGVPPIIGRLQTLWQSMRGVVVETLPPAQGLPKDREAYLAFIDEIYKSDAYHSLSIEGYRVTPELIESVRSGDWNPDQKDSDRQRRDALAARGYWQAFQLVRETVSEIITGANPSDLVRSTHRDWYRELFQPSVAVGLIPPSSLAGFRTDQVFLRSSRHVPPRWEVISDAMSVLFDLLEHETDPAVRAVLGHWLFGYVHPYQDGNGRIARFLMNAMLASGGYPWTVIRVEDRTNYLSSLESASVQNDIRPFAVFVAKQMQLSMDQARQSNRVPSTHL